MGTQTMTENHETTTVRNYGQGETEITTGCGVVVKATGGKVSFMIGGAQGDSIHMKMTQENAIIYAQAIIQAATNASGYDDAFRFVQE